MKEEESRGVRLNKFIAERTGVSRREADELISTQRVEIREDRGSTIDDRKIAVLGQRVGGDTQVFIDGRLIQNNVVHTTILLNKPVGYLSSRRSQGGLPTVYDLLPPEYKTLKTAGRLDRDSSGLMLLSTDGDLIQKLTHPRYVKTKVYKIELDRPLEPLHQQMISDIGINLPDGKSQISLQRLSDHATNRPSDSSWLATMHEGRNRQIRRTFAALGYTVTRLHRISFGPYALDGLDVGQWKIAAK